MVSERAIMKLTGPIAKKRKGEVIVDLDSAEDRELGLYSRAGRSFYIGETYEAFKKLGFQKAVHVVRGKVNLGDSTVIYEVREVK